jgi:hypothetical protein
MRIATRWAIVETVAVRFFTAIRARDIWLYSQAIAEITAIVTNHTFTSVASCSEICHNFIGIQKFPTISSTLKTISRGYPRGEDYALIIERFGLYDMSRDEIIDFVRNELVSDAD